MQAVAAAPAEGYLCNERLSVRRSWSDWNRTWELGVREQELCYSAYEGRQWYGDLSRNWCWAAFKKFGCHQSLYVKPRPHPTWKEMGQRASAEGSVPWPSQTRGRDFQPLRRPEVCDRKELGAARAWSAKERAAARAWFDEHVAAFVLNLETSVEEWENFQARAAALDLEVQRVLGVDLRRASALEAAQREGLVPWSFNFSRSQELADRDGVDGIAGTVGCAAGHFRAQEQILLAGWRRKPLAVVFEDDVLPDDDFVPRLWSLAREELPCDWDAVALRAMCPYGECVSPHLLRVQPDANEPESRCRHGVNYGFQGVLYRVDALPRFQKEWKQVVFDSERPRCLDIDVALASLSDRVSYYAVPFVQFPGFLRETGLVSRRSAINLHVQVSAAGL